METPAARLASLRAAVAADAAPGNRLAHAVTLDLLDRAAATDEPPPGWGQLPDAALAMVGDIGWPMAVASMANVVAVTGLGEPRDFLALSRLVKRFGHGPVASAQAITDARLGTGPGNPLTTRFAWQVVRTTEIVGGLVADGLPPEQAAEVADRCHRSAFWLVVADVDTSAPGPELRTVEDIVRCTAGGITAWRAQLAILAANPWTPYAADLQQLLVESGRPDLAQGCEALVAYYRNMSEQRDRQLVAREVRRLVAVSGLSQRQFAALAGTSAPRLSTYVNGLVTPSASMMVRLTRVSGRAQEQARQTGGSSA